MTTGVTVNAICPGYVATEMTWAGARNIQKRTGRAYEEAVQALAAFSPQKRLIEPDEVAALALFLAGPDARGINGQTLGIDGGELPA